MRTLAAALFVLMTAGAAQAQTYVPGQTQQMLNQEQLNMQSQQLQQLQRLNAPALQGADPTVRSQAAITQQQIRQQTDQTNALRQQMLSPSANPSNLNAQIQAGGARIQQIQPSVGTP